MKPKPKDTYFVAVKVFLEKDGRLLILKDRHGGWDLPGGRILINEFKTPLDKIVKRKLKEELGGAIRYQIGRPVVFMRHERLERIPGRPKVRIFALGYDGLFKSGIIKISSRHTKLKWVSLANFKPKAYFTGGWLKGVKDYLSLKKNS